MEIPERKLIRPGGDHPGAVDAASRLPLRRGSSAGIGGSDAADRRNYTPLPRQTDPLPGPQLARRYRKCRRQRFADPAGTAIHGQRDRSGRSLPCKTKPPTVREVYEELRQLDEEFERVQYHHDSKLLCVVTDRIELEGTYLGDFEIQLHVPSLAEMRRNHAIYRIVALDPHPASCNEHVTHPHVSDEHLCEGDASAAIEAALANGRVCDFFILVRSVLTPTTTRTPLTSGWTSGDGTPCYDCGCSCSSDEMYFCESCERDFCSECYSCCRVCDTSMCFGCLTRCQGCDHHVCGECMTSCDVCGESFCKNCVSECKECGDQVWRRLPGHLRKVQ